jgi:hypothetical protein
LEELEQSNFYLADDAELESCESGLKELKQMLYSAEEDE